MQHTDSEYDVWLDTERGEKYLCNTLGVHWTTKIDETGELYCERCNKVVSDNWRWSRTEFAALFGVDIIVLLFAAVLAVKGDWIGAFLFSGMGMWFLSESVGVYLRQKQES